LHGNGHLARCVACDRQYTKQEVGWEADKWGPGYRTQRPVKEQPACPGANDNESFKQKFIVTTGQREFPLATIVSIGRGRFSGTYKVDATTSTP
jgi:NAD-dependent SIR2 family protein deacetylase